MNSYAKVLGELQNSDVLGASGDHLDGVPPVRYYAFGDPWTESRAFVKDYIFFY